MTYANVILTTGANLAAIAAFTFWASINSYRDSSKKIVFYLNEDYVKVAVTALAAYSSIGISNRILSGISTELPSGVAGTLAELAIRLFVAENMNTFVETTLTRGVNTIGYLYGIMK